MLTVKFSSGGEKIADSKLSWFFHSFQGIYLDKGCNILYLVPVPHQNYSRDEGVRYTSAFRKSSKASETVNQIPFAGQLKVREAVALCWGERECGANISLVPVQILC